MTTTTQHEQGPLSESAFAAEDGVLLGGTVSALLSNHPVPVMVIDTAGRIAYANAAVSKLLGWAINEFIGVDLAKFCKATAEATIHAALSQSLESFTKPGKAFCKDGYVLDVIYQTSGFIDEQTGAYWSMISVKDQSEVSRLHRLLGETNRLAKVGSWELDVKSGSLFWSDVTREIHEVPYDFIPTVENAINFYLEGEHRNKILEYVNTGIESGKAWDDDFIITTARGTQKWVRAKGSVVYDSHGNVARIYGAFQDIQEQKLKDLELKASHKQLTGILDNSHDMICTFDMDGKYVSVNNAVTQLLGYEPDEIAGKTYLEIAHPDYWEQISHVIAQLKNGESVRNVKDKQIRKDGQVITALWSAYLDAENQVGVGIMRDITELDLAYQRLQEREQTLSDIADNIPGIVYQFRIKQDGSSYFSYISKHFEELTDGLLKINDTNWNLDRMLTEESLLAFKSAIQESLKGNYQSQFNLNYIRDDQSIATIEINSAKPTIHEGELVFNGVGIDVTDKVAREKEIRKLSLIAEKTHNGVVVTDAAAQIIWFNKSFEQLSGYTKHELIGVRPQDLLQRPGTNLEAKAHIRRAINDKQPFSAELLNYTKQGQPYWILIEAQPVFDNDGQLLYYFGIQTDITQHKRDQEEREAIIRELTAVNLEQRQFSYLVSHNLKAPVTNILALLDLLKKQMPELAGHEYVTMLNQTSVELNDTLNELVKVLSYKENKSKSLSSLDFWALFDRIKRQYHHELEQANAEIEADISPELHFKSNASFCELIFSNLFSNAIRFRHPNRPLKIKVNVVQENGILTFSITDNGTGFPAHVKRDSVYGLKMRFDRERSGQGLGLFMVRAVISAMGGSIQLESEAGQGSNFTVLLPVEK